MKKVAWLLVAALVLVMPVASARAEPTKVRLVMVGIDCGDAGRPSAAKPYLSGTTIHFNGYTTCDGYAFDTLESVGLPMVDGVVRSAWTYDHTCSPGVDPCSSNVAHSPPLPGCHNYRTRTHGYVKTDPGVIWWDLGSVTSNYTRICG